MMWLHDVFVYSPTRVLLILLRMMQRVHVHMRENAQRSREHGAPQVSLRLSEGRAHRSAHNRSGAVTVVIGVGGHALGGALGGGERDVREAPDAAGGAAGGAVAAALHVVLHKCLLSGV